MVHFIPDMKPTIKSNLANGRNVHIKRKEETNLKSDEEVEVVCDGGSAINGVTVSSFLFRCSRGCSTNSLVIN